MVTAKVYVNYADRPIHDWEDFVADPYAYFFPVSDFDTLSRELPALVTGNKSAHRISSPYRGPLCFLGAVTIQYDNGYYNKSLIGVTLFVEIEYLCIYFAHIFKEFYLRREAYRSFPDQPIRFGLKEQDWHNSIFSIDHPKEDHTVVPTLPFISAVLHEVQFFFQSCIEACDNLSGLKQSKDETDEVMRLYKLL